MTRKDTDRLAVKVARHFSAPEWFTIFEIPLYDSLRAEGDGKIHQIDALAISRISGRGNEVHGVEIKSDRSDWLRELADPLKAQAWCKLVDRFWVAASEGVVQMDELPKTWGLLLESGSGLRKARQAPLLREHEAPDPIRRELWVRILRKTLDHDSADPRLGAEYQRGFDAGKRESTEGLRREAENATWELKELKEGVAAFEKEVGLPRGELRGAWSGKHLGARVKVTIEREDLLWSAANDARNLRRCVDDLEKALKESGYREES